MSEGTKWEGYSNYELVSKRVSKSVSEAIDSYSLLESAHREDATVNPDTAANARADILSAAMRLLVEMKQEADNGVDEYDEILARWMGGDDESKGQIQQLQEARLHESVPGWMFDFVSDIREAAWRLGYLQAGRRSKRRPEDPDEAEVMSMFEEM